MTGGNKLKMTGGKMILVSAFGQSSFAQTQNPFVLSLSKDEYCYNQQPQSFRNELLGLHASLCR
jgi:hypothetical protein